MEPPDRAPMIVGAGAMAVMRTQAESGVKNLTKGSGSRHIRE
ncbi:hypothetical protein [Acetobacter estunensis]|nr:hypothetical protein [Acetobacter estunensis]